MQHIVVRSSRGRPRIRINFLVRLVRTFAVTVLCIVFIGLAKYYLGFTHEEYGYDTEQYIHVNSGIDTLYTIVITQKQTMVKNSMEKSHTKGDTKRLEMGSENENISNIEERVRDLERLWKQVDRTAVNVSELTFNESTRVYQINNKPLLWLYWDGPQMPAYIRLCILTIACHNMNDFTIKLLNDTEFIKSVPNVHPYFKSLTPNHKADYFRASVLNEYGGTYIDADTISFKSVRETHEKLTEYDLTVCGNDLYKYYTSNIGPVRAHTMLTERWISEIHRLMNNTASFGRVLKYGKDPFTRSRLAIQIFEPTIESLLKNKQLKHYYYDASATWGQFDSGAIMSTSRDLVRELKETDLLVLQNDLYPKELKSYSAAQVLKAPFGLSKLLSHSLNKCLVVKS